MTYQEFRKAYPATRCFERYSSEERANHAASHRLGRRQREAVGEFYYVHEMIPDRGFETAKIATTQAYKVFMANKTRVEPLKIRIDAIIDADHEHAAEVEALVAEPVRHRSRA